MEDSKWRDLIIDGFGRLPAEVKEILSGLKVKDLEFQPAGVLNSIGWTIWHLIRVQDSQIADLMEKEHLWIKDSWCKKFNRPADPADTGYEHSKNQVKAFRSPEPQIYLDYLKATTDRTKNYLLALQPSDLDRELDEPWFTPRPTVGVRIVSILADCHEHLGEASYIKGLLGKS